MKRISYLFLLLVLIHFVDKETCNASNCVGQQNCISANCSSVMGGCFNTVKSDYSAIYGGSGNCIESGYLNSFIAGQQNYIKANCSFIAGGCFNQVKSDYSGIIAGCGNIIDASSINSFIAVGQTNYISGNDSFIGSGYKHCIYANCSSILGGCCHVVCSDYSAILGGCGNTIPASMPCTSVFGYGITALCGCAMHINQLVLYNIPMGVAGPPVAPPALACPGSLWYYPDGLGNKVVYVV